MWSMLPVTDTAHISRDQCFLWLKQHTFYDASCDRYSTHITWSMLYVAETAQVLRCSCDRYSTHITWSVVSVAETAHFLRDQVFLWLRLCIFYVTRPFSDWDCTHFTSPKAYCHWGCTHSTSPKLYVTDTAHILRHQSFMWLILHTFYVTKALCNWHCTHVTWSALPVIETVHINFYVINAFCDCTHFTWSALCETETVHILHD